MIFVLKVTALIILVAMFGSGTVVAETVAIYPTPQICELSRDSTDVKEVEVYRRKKKDRGQIWNRLPKVSGGYALIITPGKLSVYANDAAGLYYAKQSLSQLLLNRPKGKLAQRDPYPGMSPAQIAAQGKLPIGRVIDWPDLPFRGVVEGYYGTPWSFEARRSQFEFYGRNKMNLYIYGPKNDPYHHGEGCYKPYPAKMEKQLATLVRHAKKHHVHFVWAIHPANTVNWQQNGGKDDMDKLCKKLRQLYKVGVRYFGVFVDDTSGEIKHAHRQAELCNYILENFIRKHPKAYQNLIMCPSGYNRGWTNPGWLRELGNKLHPSTMVMWTGNTVVHDITRSGQEWVKTHLGRPTFIWWNWPCSDFKRTRLSMGRTYGLDTAEEMKTLMSGFVANPMEQAEASKIGLFGVADYTWNISAFDSGTSWRQGIARLYPAQKNAMQLFCNHNSHLLPNVHNYFREESVDIRATADTYRQSLANGSPDSEATVAMHTEFLRMIRTADVLNEAKGDVAVLAKEIQPWLIQFKHTGNAGAELIDSLTGEESKRAEHFVNAVTALENMKTTERPHWNGTQVIRKTGVEVGSLVITPTVQETLKFAAQQLYATLSGQNAQTASTLQDRVQCSLSGLQLVATRSDTDVSIDPILEQLTFSPNDSIELLLSTASKCKGLVINLDNEQTIDRVKITLTTADGKTLSTRPKISGSTLTIPTADMPRAGICRITLKYTGKTTSDFKLNTFKLDLAEQQTDANLQQLSDADLTTFILSAQAPDSITLTVPNGCQEVLLIGNANATVSPVTASHSTGALHSYSLAPGTGSITIKLTKKPNTRLHEIIFRQATSTP